MKRARLIIKEVQVTRQGEIKNFQIKIPKNIRRIIAIETDVRIDGRTEAHPKYVPSAEPVASEGRAIDSAPMSSVAMDSMATASVGTVSVEMDAKPTLPFLSWTIDQNPVLGKLKLRSMERTNIFFEEWLHLIMFSGGMPDMSGGLLKNNPSSLNRNRVPKKVEVPKMTTLINGLFEDTLGRTLKKDIRYLIKVFVWGETDEDADGVVFDFQSEEVEIKERRGIKW